MEKYLKNKTIMSVAGIVFGLILMIWRGQFVEQMIRVAGYILLAAAAVYLVMYFRSNRQKTPRRSSRSLAQNRKAQCPRGKKGR